MNRIKVSLNRKATHIGYQLNIEVINTTDNDIHIAIIVNDTAQKTFDIKANQGIETELASSMSKGLAHLRSNQPQYILFNRQHTNNHTNIKVLIDDTIIYEQDTTIEK